MKRLLICAAAFAVMVLLTGPQTVFAQHDDPDMEWEMAEDETTGTLFSRLGGQEKITTIVGDFVSIILADDKLKGHFEKADQAQWKKDLTGQLTKAAGGETDFAGKTVRESLTAMGLTEEEFQATGKQLAASLEKSQIAKADGDALLVALEFKKPEPEPAPAPAQP